LDVGQPPLGPQRSFNIIARHGDIAWRQQADIIIEPDVKSFVWDDFTAPTTSSRSAKLQRWPPCPKSRPY